MINEKNNFLTVSWLSGLLSAEIFISTGVANRNSKDISFVPFVYVLRTSAVKACLRRECC